MARRQHDELVARYELSHPVFTALKPFLNGGCAGMMSCCVVHPLDTLKVVLQAQSGSIEQGRAGGGRRGRRGGRGRRSARRRRDPYGPRLSACHTIAGERSFVQDKRARDQ